MTKFVFISNTGGSSLSRLLRHDWVLQRTKAVVSNQECGAIDVARQVGVYFEVFATKTGEDFSKVLNETFFEEDLIFILYFTKLLSDTFVASRIGRVFNCHTSILPACSGLNGFGKTLRSNSLFMGSTLHEVDLGIDSGLSIIQAAFPLDRRVQIKVNRHKVFLMQYYSTLQFMRWIDCKRLVRKKSWQLENGTYKSCIFSPNLDIDFFDFFEIKDELRASD